MYVELGAEPGPQLRRHQMLNMNCDTSYKSHLASQLLTAVKQLEDCLEQDFSVFILNPRIIEERITRV